MFWINSFFKLGNAVRICDPDSPICGFFGNVVGIHGINGQVVEYGVEIVPGQITVGVLPHQLEPN